MKIVIYNYLLHQDIYSKLYKTMGNSYWSVGFVDRKLRIVIYFFIYDKILYALK